MATAEDAFVTDEAFALAALKERQERDEPQVRR